MKKILTGIIALLLLLGSSKAGWGQNFSEKFLEHIPKKTAIVATVNSSMIEALKKWEVDEELQAFLNELSFLRIITIPTSADINLDSYCIKVREQVKKHGQGEELLSINDKQRQTLLMIFDKTANNKAGEIVFINCDESVLVIINITGNISIGNLGQLSNLSKSFKKL
ncbi:MAG: DUF4252 domain-containing protein [Prevotellaceae bacterium]|jgi:hypothetical protein|nr:DUF4252 domain-containing protein [Prevotellaceae bacterium]